VNTIATTGTTVSGMAVPIAASTLPVAPAPRPRRRPSHSTPLVNTSAPRRMAAKPM